ncbi:uncharacterized protein C2845_PM05G27870 [Panicum miliaceum]|uniref:Transcription repressor n=1 Tax=Panicum miliaceum TaxID=4540 RepID=A0A3L6T1A5_PANMI|nr:uncharacterized protein C2845_PM05G27870 [Panicum miliaceum]
MDKSRQDRTGGHGVGGVAGRLRQRLAQILLHSSCATTSATTFIGVASSTNAAAATVTSDAAASRQEPPPPRCAHKQRPKPIDARSQRRRSSRPLVHISIDCSARSVGAAVLPSPMPAARDVGAVKSGARKKGDGDKARSPLYSWSSSTDTDGELAPFSSDGEGGQATDTRSTVFSSHSFSSDSTADFYTATGPCARPRRHKNPPRRAPPRRAPRPADASRPDKEKKKLVDRKDGAVAAAGSTAVVKRSHNPYADFRSSMVEMVAGRRLRGADALGELLVWYLSLNSRRHHPAILAAFEDVWEADLGNDP